MRERKREGKKRMNERVSVREKRSRGETVAISSPPFGVVRRAGDFSDSAISERSTAPRAVSRFSPTTNASTNVRALSRLSGRRMRSYDSSDRLYSRRLSSPLRSFMNGERRALALDPAAHAASSPPAPRLRSQQRRLTNSSPPIYARSGILFRVNAS